MQTLSKEAEQAIIKAATEAVELVDSGGLSPDAAVEKIARREKLGAHKVRFLAHAYNTGRQTAQRESADTSLGKFADFPLVDPERVISAIFPATKEAAIKTAGDLGVSRDYALPPQWPSLRAVREKQAWASREKQAAAARPQPAKPSVTGIEYVYNEHLMFKRAAEDARTKVGQANDRLISAMGRLADYFKQAPYSRVKFAAAEFAAQTYFGSSGQKLMDFVYARNKMKEARAADKMPLIEADFSVAPYNLIQTCIDSGKSVISKQAAEKRATDALEQHAIEKLAPHVSSPKVLKRASDSLIPEKDLHYYDADDVLAFLPHRLHRKEAVVKQAEAPADDSLLAGLGAFNKQAGTVSNWSLGTAVGMGTKGMLENAFGGDNDPAGKVNDAYLDLEDPAHDSQLRQIRSQALLTDMMNDDVIGGHDPDDVARAYNEISQMAPRTATQPIALRSLLRHHLTSNLEPHEAQQVTQLESGLMGTNSPTPESLQPVPKNNVSKPQPKAAGDNYRIIADDPIDSIL